MAKIKKIDVNIGDSEKSEKMEYAQRKEIAFICDNGHEFIIPFAAEAELPTVWDCAKCGTEAVRKDGVSAEPKVEKSVRTHWDMLTERRSIPELEGILAERLAEIREKKLT